MKVKLLSGDEWANAKEKIIAFAIRFGDSRLTASGIEYPAGSAAFPSK